jgi:hypothetical protein
VQALSISIFYHKQENACSTHVLQEIGQQPNRRKEEQEQEGNKLDI